MRLDDGGLLKGRGGMGDMGSGLVEDGERESEAGELVVYYDGTKDEDSQTWGRSERRTRRGMCGEADRPLCLHCCAACTSAPEHSLGWWVGRLACCHAPSFVCLKAVGASCEEADFVATTKTPVL